MSIRELLEDTEQRGQPRGGPAIWAETRAEIESAEDRDQFRFLATVAAVALVLTGSVLLLVSAGGSDVGSVEASPAHNGVVHDDEEDPGPAPDEALETPAVPTEGQGQHHPDPDPADGQPADGRPVDDASAADDSTEDGAVSEDASEHGDHAPSTVTYTPQPDCELGDTVPVGQANPTAEPEPMGAVWCFDRMPAPEATAESTANGWVDDFTVGGGMHQFADGDLDYRLFDRAGENPPEQAAHWLNHNHWMVDSTGAFTGGSSMRPDRSFGFENGVLTVEADVAASVPEFGTDHWVELTVTDAPVPNAVADGLYAYGQFGDTRAIGCRLHATDSSPICAHYAPAGDTITPGCFSVGQRQMEISWFQHCGQTSGGGPWATDPAHPGLTAADFARACEPNQSDIHCRDRFRMELTDDSLTLFVNGFKQFESTDWPADKTLPADFVDGELYVYFSSWSYRSDGELVRFHWDRIAVNPTTGPSAAPSFCLGETQNTCPGATHH